MLYIPCHLRPKKKKKAIMQLFIHVPSGAVQTPQGRASPRLRVPEVHTTVSGEKGEYVRCGVGPIHLLLEAREN